jgi:hypothetical protein
MLGGQFDQVRVFPDMSFPIEGNQALSQRSSTHSCDTYS